MATTPRWISRVFCLSAALSAAPAAAKPKPGPPPIGPGIYRGALEQRDVSSGKAIKSLEIVMLLQREGAPGHIQGKYFYVKHGKGMLSIAGDVQSHSVELREIGEDGTRTGHLLLWDQPGSRLVGRWQDMHGEGELSASLKRVASADDGSFCRLRLGNGAAPQPMADCLAEVRRRPDEKAFKAEANDLGFRLPEGISREAAVAAALTIDERKRVSAVGVIPWKQFPNRYVALYCLPDDGKQAGTDRCEQASAVLAVLQLTDGKPSLVARSEGSFVLPYTPAPDEKPAPTADGTTEDKRDTDFLRFDDGRYELAPGDLAFGLRTARYFTLPGGGGRVVTLHLFRVKGKGLRRVASVRTEDSSMGNAGWSEQDEGVPIKHEEESRWKVSVASSTTNQYRDLAVKQVAGGKGQALYRWDEAKDIYVGSVTDK